MNSEQYRNSKVKILGERVYSPNLRDVAVLVSLAFLTFLTFAFHAFGGKKLETNVWQKCDSTFSSTASSLKFGQHNLLPSI